MWPKKLKEEKLYKLKAIVYLKGYSRKVLDISIFESKLGPDNNMLKL
jgi:hypothetical protein